MTVAQQSDASIGSVTELKGIGRIVRDIPYDAALSFDIESYDNVETTNGRIGITFLNDTKVRLTEHSQLLIDEFIYDPDPSKSKMALQFASGTARFITGKLNTINKENIAISTPSANVSIRGTDFTVTVNELGESLIILLPKDDGTPSGEIVVATAIGEVILNQPYQATTVSMFETEPTKPVILDITLELIDNMLIVNPPKEDVNVTEKSVSSNSNNLLDVDYLEFEDLDIDYLASDDLEFTELDINYLDVNFLEDLLEIIQDVNELDQTETLLQADLDLKGTTLGFDPDTQINTFTTDNTITFVRALENTVRVDLDKSNAYTVILIQNGKSTQIIVNGGSSSTITIKQNDTNTRAFRSFYYFKYYRGRCTTQRWLSFSSSRLSKYSY